MATRNHSRSKCLSLQMLLLLHFFMIAILFFLTIPLASALSFNFTSFSPNDYNMKYNGSSYAADGIIQLILNQKDQKLTTKSGRAAYREPLRLWDNATGVVTDFTTHFSFVINSQGRTPYADGLAFFLAPNGSTIQTVAGGGAFGLTKDNEPLNSSEPFVAVEFDIFYNDGWDPITYDHVGIDISSVKSLNYSKWWSNITGGATNDAWITYNSSAQNLSVVFTGFRNNTKVMQYLEYKVNLKSHLPQWVTFGFSAATGGYSAIHTINSWQFSSSLEVDDNSTPTETSPNPNLVPDRRKRKGKNVTALAVGLSIGGGVLVAGLVWVWLAGVGRKRDRDGEEDNQDFSKYMDDEFEKGTGPKKFSYKELAAATNKFIDEQKLGQGGFGGVYKGFLRDTNSYIAVKRVSKGSKQGIKEYASEVSIISKLRHKNLVQLLGWCHEKKELLLVYEFMPNGSLDSHLFKDNLLLTWEMRYKIAQDLASGLLYLHEEWEQCVVHRDIKSSNIMLDSNFNAKIGDFGLARLVEHAKGSQTTLLAGTMGYMAPECVITGKASRETDVYSFGIVALEIACGRKPINPMVDEGQVHLVQWVWEFYGSGKLLDAADPRLREDYDKQQVQLLMTVGLWCAHPDENLRPSIRQAIRVLKSEAPLPILPPKMPVPTYFSQVNTTTSIFTNLYTATNYSESTSSSAASSSTATLLHTR